MGWTSRELAVRRVARELGRTMAVNSTPKIMTRHVNILPTTVFGTMSP